MSKSPEKVRVILSHNQEIDGKEQKAGAEVEIDPRLARALKSRGSVQIKAETVAKEAAADPEAATVAELRALAEQRGVDLSGATRKAEIQAALDAAPETTAAPAEKGGKR